MEKKLQKRGILLFCFLIITISGFSQPTDLTWFKMAGINAIKTEVNQLITETTVLQVFPDLPAKIYGLAVSGNISFNGEAGFVRVVLIDNTLREYIVYEMYSLLAKNPSIAIDQLGEETCLLDGIFPASIRVEIQNATFQLGSLFRASGVLPGINIPNLMGIIDIQQELVKILTLNENLQSMGMSWVAGETGISKLTYADRKKLYGNATLPPGLEYYTGGIFQMGATLKSATGSSFVSVWDWRNRHGKDWVTRVTDQGSCGSCWAFSSVGAAESAVNLFFNNETIDPDLSEQDVISCSGGGNCDGGHVYKAIDYITNTGVTDEAAFPYTASVNTCANKSASPSELIRIAGKMAFGSATYPVTEDNLKAMVIRYGPLAGIVTDWSHAMILIGWKVVAAGDIFFTRNTSGETGRITIPSGSPLIGTTVWLYKNSWSGNWGDGGYVYVQSAISNLAYTYGLVTPVSSVLNPRTVTCADRDGDGYYWWGTGVKPSNCPACPELPDGDDSNNQLGPLDAFGNCIPINAPVADFSAGSTDIGEGESVSFMDLSTNNPITWNWTFEGGNPASSGLQNPMVTYAVAGTYGVTLTASNAGGSNTVTKTGYIRVASVNPVPVAAFTASTFLVAKGGSVSFFDQSTNNPTSWAWTFEGGEPQTSTSRNPLVVYSTPGTYDVSLLATNGVGSGYKSESNFITVVDSVALVSGYTSPTTSVMIGSTITLAGQSISLPAYWAWVFPGNIFNTSTTQSKTATYTTTLGSLPVTVTGSITVSAISYCASKGNAAAEWISSVSFGSSSNPSGTSGNTGYQDFTSKVFSAAPGSTVKIILVPKFSGLSASEYWCVWIDFNGDGDFTDSGEKVFTQGPAAGKVTSAISIPAGLNLTTRMRVAMKRNAAPSPCETFLYGEAEDYSVKIAPAFSWLKNAELAEKEGLLLYPNPADRTIQIQTGESMIGSVYDIYNNLGKKQVSGIIENVTETIDLTGFVSGIYMVIVRQNEVVLKGKFIKQ